jgi:protein-S-isoprenylcysteine O-methyltransferase Ste14
MDKLNFFGVGPKIGRIAIPWLIIMIVISIVFKGSFTFLKIDYSLLLYKGIGLVIIGLLMYFFTLPNLLKGLKESKLVRNGAFYLCCNPLYTSIILFIIPGISLMLNSWLVLTTSLVGYVLFKMHIKSEYAEMEKFFGDEYRKYKAITPEFLPFPVKKWFGKK